MTLDTSIVATPTNIVTLDVGTGRSLVEGHMILELKYSGVFPRVFKDLVDVFQLSPKSASKYRFAVQTLGLASSTAVAGT
jgi:hypothetical protein